MGGWVGGSVGERASCAQSPLLDVVDVLPLVLEDVRAWAQSKKMFGTRHRSCSALTSVPRAYHNLVIVIRVHVTEREVQIPPI